MIFSRTPKTRWLKFNGDKRIEKAAMDAADKPGWNPKVVKLSRYMLAIDYSFTYDGEVDKFKVLLFKDHPSMRALNRIPGVPKVCKQVFRADKALAYARADEYWPWHYDVKYAEKAWNDFLYSLWTRDEKKFEEAVDMGERVR